MRRFPSAHCPIKPPLGNAFKSSLKIHDTSFVERMAPNDSTHRFRKTFQVGICVETVRFRKRRKRADRGAGFALLDSAKLPFGETRYLGLNEPCRFAQLTDRSPVARVVALGSLLRFSKLVRIDRLKELIPSQMNIEVRPMDKGAVNVDYQVPQHIAGLTLQGVDGVNRNV